MIASDIHGSAYYCEKLLELFQEEKADKLLLLGDILYHGPRNPLPKEYSPAKVADLLNNLKENVLCVRGNCDSEVDQMVLEFPIMADYAVIEVDGVTLFATHGHIFNLENIPPFCPNTVLLNGHFHVTVCDKKKDFIYMNPGSVSLPKECTNHSCILFKNNHFRWVDLQNKETFKTFQITG